MRKAFFRLALTITWLIQTVGVPPACAQSVRRHAPIFSTQALSLRPVAWRAYRKAMEWYVNKRFTLKTLYLRYGPKEPVIPLNTATSPWPATAEVMKEQWVNRYRSPAYQRARKTYLGTALHLLRAQHFFAPNREVEHDVDLNDYGYLMLEGFQQWLGEVLHTSDIQISEGIVEFYNGHFRRPLSWDEWMLIVELEQYGLQSLDFLWNGEWTGEVIPPSIPSLFQFAELVALKIPFFPAARWLEKVCLAAVPIVLGGESYAVIRNLNQDKKQDKKRYGGTSTVFFGRQLSSGREVVLKATHDPHWEVVKLMGLQKQGLPHLLKLLYVHKSQTNVLITEREPADTVYYVLRQLLGDPPLWSLEVVQAQLALVLRAAKALKAWHVQGFVRGGLHSQNILYRYHDGAAVFVDYESGRASDYFTDDVLSMAGFLTDALPQANEGNIIVESVIEGLKQLISPNHSDALHDLKTILNTLVQRTAEVHIDQLIEAIEKLGLASDAVLEERIRELGLGPEPLARSA